MGRLRRTVVAAAVTAATAGAVTLTAGPAAAVTEGCTISSGNSCSTSARPIPANAAHQIHVEAFGALFSGGVTCYAYDLNGALVGQVYAPAGWTGRKTIPGLYGWYFLTCVGARYAGGSISNG
jgi:hypothetical protein